MNKQVVPNLFLSSVKVTESAASRLQPVSAFSTETSRGSLSSSSECQLLRPLIQAEALEDSKSRSSTKSYAIGE